MMKFLFSFFLLSFMFMMEISFNWMFTSVSYCLVMDLLSLKMILLSFWICSLMILASEKLFKLN